MRQVGTFEVTVPTEALLKPEMPAIPVLYTGDPGGMRAGGNATNMPSAHVYRRRRQPLGSLQRRICVCAATPRSTSHITCGACVMCCGEWPCTIQRSTMFRHPTHDAHRTSLDTVHAAQHTAPDPPPPSHDTLPAPNPRRR